MCSWRGNNHENGGFDLVTSSRLLTAGNLCSEPIFYLYWRLLTKREKTNDFLNRCAWHPANRKKEVWAAHDWQREIGWNLHTEESKICFFWTGVFDDDIRLNIPKAELKIKRQSNFLLQSATSYPQSTEMSSCVLQLTKKLPPKQQLSDARPKNCVSSSETTFEMSFTQQHWMCIDHGSPRGLEQLANRIRHLISWGSITHVAMQSHLLVTVVVAIE